MPKNDLRLVNKMLEKVVYHEKIVRRFENVGIFNFVENMLEFQEEYEKKLAQAIEEHESFKKDFEYFRDSGMDKKLDILKEASAVHVIKTVNERNGGPVTEGKVLDMIDEQRQQSIKHDIDSLE